MSDANYNFRNISVSQNIDSGVAEFILLAPVSWFTADGIKSPAAPFDNPGDSIIIKTPHVFNDGKAWIRYQLAPQKNELGYKTVGDLGLSKLNAEAKIFIPGSWPEVHEAVQQWMNRPLLALQKDANCKADLWYHLGCDCTFAWMRPEFSTGTTNGGIKGYSIPITYDGPPMFYQVEGGPVILASESDS
jgi:hypothetical protein